VIEESIHTLDDEKMGRLHYSERLSDRNGWVNVEVGLERHNAEEQFTPCEPGT